MPQHQNPSIFDPPWQGPGPPPAPPQPTQVPSLHPLAQTLYSLPAADLQPTLNRRLDLPARQQTIPPALTFGNLLQPQQYPQTIYPQRLVQETQASPFIALLSQLLSGQNTGRYAQRLNNPMIQVIANMLAAKAPG